MHSKTILAFLLGCLTTLGVIYRGQIFEVIAAGQPFPPGTEATTPVHNTDGVKHLLTEARADATADPSPQNLQKVAALERHLKALKNLNGEHKSAKTHGLVPFFIKSVEGAPGDGNEALRREIAKVMDENDIAMVDAVEPCAAILTGTVAVTPKGDEQLVKIDWAVHTTAKIYVGSIKQNNTVPKGALDPVWGEYAVLAARGALNGLKDVRPTKGKGCP